MELSKFTACKPGYAFPPLVASGDDCGILVTGARLDAISPPDKLPPWKRWLKRLGPGWTANLRLLPRLRGSALE
jgi:hypothetical protein